MFEETKQPKMALPRFSSVRSKGAVDELLMHNTLYDTEPLRGPADFFLNCSIFERSPTLMHDEGETLGALSREKMAESRLQDELATGDEVRRFLYGRGAPGGPGSYEPV
eukprot:GHVO01048050.1.p2 GENE.GHVO01048050.1~~GHVO01048050.1.p2  ORF type:complete len:109 (-),score=14.42 GHVO01048050.1:230-556(-)